MSEPIHVYPVNDLIDHDLDGNGCVCGPSTERVETDHGDEWMITHNSLDGRELAEA